MRNYRILDNMIGHRFGLLTVLRQAPARPWASTVWICKCDCGKEVRREGTQLRKGVGTNCGCITKQLISKASKKHGMHKVPEYSVWNGMISRCNNPNVKEYKNYGGRGIKVCERWRRSPAPFLSDMGPRPTPKHQIDRIDNDGDYEPGNCRWVTHCENSRNCRTTKLDRDKVWAILKAAREGAGDTAQGRRFGVSGATIRDARLGKTWADVYEAFHSPQPTKERI